MANPILESGKVAGVAESSRPSPRRSATGLSQFHVAGPAGLKSAAFLAASLAIYLVLAGWVARTKAPWCDEGAFANPAYNLAFHGYMGSSVLEPSGHYLNAYLKGIRERTYDVVPNHLVALAVWFRVFGFSLFTMRAYSICWGAAILLTFFYLLRRLFPDPWVARLASLLMAVDFMIQWTTADGRMEAPACALALGSLAAYLFFRERDLSTAVLVSQVLAAAAMFTHPNALIIVLTVLVLAWRDDRKRFQLRHVLLAILPYLVFAELWAIYILQNTSDFAAQFFANAAGRSSTRWKMIFQPWRAIYFEAARHFGNYRASGLWAGVMNPWMTAIPFIYLAAMAGLLRNRSQSPAAKKAFLACTVTVVLGMTFLNGVKAPAYLLYAVPFYDAVLAVWLVDLWKGGAPSRLAAGLLTCAFVSIQLATTIQHIRADEYGREYLPAVQAVNNERAAGKSIAGTAALGFGLGFQGFADDWRLGLYSGLKPDVIVLDRSYREFTRRFETDEPRVFSHVVAMLTSDYRLSARYGTFWIFERVPAEVGKPAPWLDISGIGLKERGKRAEYLFEQLALSPATQGFTETIHHDSRDY
jgi:hypothetical protein